MVILFRDGFECPPNTAPSTFTAWTGASNEGSGATGSIQSLIKHHGLYAAKITGLATTSDYFYFYKNVADTYFLGYRIYFYLTADIDVGSYLKNILFTTPFYLSLGNSASGYFWDLLGGTYTSGFFSLSLNTWHWVELDTVISATVGSYKVYFDSETPVISQTGLNTGVDPLYRVASYGWPGVSGYSGDVYFDCAVAADTHIGRERRFLPLTRNMNPRFQSRTLQHM